MYELTDAQEQALEQLRDEVDAGVRDAMADFGEEVGEDDVYHDVAVGVIMTSCDDDEVAREFCRMSFGLVPHDLEQRLGRIDWLQ